MAKKKGIQRLFRIRKGSSQCYTKGKWPKRFPDDWKNSNQRIKDFRNVRELFNKTQEL